MFKRELKKLKLRLGLQSTALDCDYKADGLGVRNKELAWLTEPTFEAAWSKAVEGAKFGFAGLVPDIRWRAHIALWAARRALQLQGDFVECGVYTGLLSLTICHAIGFQNADRKFYLFDTYKGVPLDGLVGGEKELAAALNRNMYRDVYEETKRHFAPFPNAVLVKGVLPDTLSTVPLERIAYLSIDLNNAVAEKPCIETLWPLLVPGAFVVIDDYAFKGHRPQFDMWNAFSASVGAPIVTMPTGQGLMIKP